MRFASVALALVLCAALPAVAGDTTTFEDLQKLVKERAQPYILVDVRTAAEFRAGAIPTAINIPVDQIPATPPTQDKAALIVVYCRSGARSSMAASILKRAGYTNVVDFGGISRWKGEIVKP